MVLGSNRPWSNPRAGDEHHLPDPDRRHPCNRVAGDFVSSFLRALGAKTGLFSNSPDGGLGVIMSALAGIAAALAVAITLSVYFRSSYRSRRDLVKHGSPPPPCWFCSPSSSRTCGTRRWPISASIRQNPRSNLKSACRNRRSRQPDTQVELLTDRNQKLAKVEEALASTPDGRSILRGTVTLDYRTTERFMVLNLPAMPSARSGCGCRPALRIPASSDRGIWRRHRPCKWRRGDIRDS